MVFYQVKGVLVLYYEMVLVTTTFLPNVIDVNTSFPFLFSRTHYSELPRLKCLNYFVFASTKLVFHFNNTNSLYRNYGRVVLLQILQVLVSNLKTEGGHHFFSSTIPKKFL
jgi:hypothetical protein